MNKTEALNRMVAPSQRRPGKPRGGVIQIHVTRKCDKACFNCTQGSNLRGVSDYITLENFELACRSLQDYWGVVGVFGGNPAMHPKFQELCEILAKHIPKDRCGLWCNNPFTHENARAMRETFNPAVSNLNVHFDQRAFDLFREVWPESRPFGLEKDSRHSPVHGSMLDMRNLPAATDHSKPVENTAENRWELISRCDINQHWSAMTAQVRGELRGFFCEIAGAQAILQQGNPDYPATGIRVKDDLRWWDHNMDHYSSDVELHCHNCLVPLRGRGELAQQEDERGVETTTASLLPIYRPRRASRTVTIIQSVDDLNGALGRMTDYLGNAQT